MNNIGCSLIYCTTFVMRYTALQMSLQEIFKMSTIQIRVDDELKKSAYQAFEKLNLSPSDALRLFLRYVAENEKLPFSEVSVMVSNQDEDADILAVVRERLKNPAKRIRVNIDDL
ncbi:bifunctional antitoxin/transcriptional repressor RelB [Yersinia enterocolitica]|uniref:Bifunctional antitoxin/transcriptional repressor RelB n=2 Tax=Yersinia TaxID=629 RepID=A0A0T9LYB6_YERKR|nr:bifunctional antitoxin/transcriptional repressor RelB [Yersinia enterocolitica]CFR19179.1 bifunctional antitoxin/transcriptional repressor RelB [Yersinia kristensenii]VTP87708.1 bifunctional antitoxin/transcriptional repressor RelB [Yersinia enterocolitica subsp. enterocolitica]CNE26194.1 bifunctional antitoxin/transcriptional repressor RelB [Yersinia enterocolitica]CNF22424.1 bifunctional antitoxin/transcriptional repressor RelB [Yersinia enterocolitica]